MLAETKSQSDNMKAEKKKDKKIFIKYLAMLAIFFLFGMGCGVAAKFLGDMAGNYESAFEVLTRALGYAVPVIFIVGNISIFLVSLRIYHKARKMGDMWDGEEETLIDELERLQNYPILLSNIALICNFVFFAVNIELTIDQIKSGGSLLFWMNIVVFLVSYGLEMIVIKLVYDLEKKLNPEKKGNVFDMHFNRKWLESSDEAQKQIIYISAYSAYQAANKACAVLCAIAVAAQLCLGTGVFPIICICTIWIVLVVTSTRMTMKLENGRN